MAKWFYLIDGQSAGPIEPAGLKQLATSGRLKPTDKVRREDLQEWYEAKQVKGLFAAGQSQTNFSATAGPNPQSYDGRANTAPPPTPEITSTRSQWSGYRQTASELMTYSRNDSFWEWYSRGIGQQSAVVQGLLWVCYGFVWIPLYWVKTGLLQNDISIPISG